MSASTTLLPFQLSRMSTAELGAVSFLARYSGRTHALYSFRLREWFAWCERHGLDPLVGIQRAHVELSIRSLGERGLTVGQVDERISADEDIPNALQQLARSQDRAQVD